MLDEKNIIDWVCPPIVDCVWNRFLTIGYLTEHLRVECECPTVLWTRISCICTATRVSMSRLYLAVERPYLAMIADPNERSVIIRSELSLKLFFQEIQERATALKIEIVCAGGYPSWRLERHLDVNNGGDALPRSIRKTMLGCSRDVLEYWIPHNIDIYTYESDADVVVNMLQDAYVRYVRRNFSVETEQMCAFVRGGDTDDGADGYKTDAEHEQEYQVSLSYLDEMPNLSHAARTSIRRVLQQTRVLQPLPVVFKKMWTCLSSLQLMFEANSIVVWNVSVPGPKRPLRELLRNGMPLSHTAIQIAMRDGEWVFEGTRESIANLAARNIEIINTHSYKFVMQSIQRYCMCGFSIGVGEGEAFVASERVTIAQGCAHGAPLTPLEDVPIHA